jgi:ribosomal protein S15
MGDPVRSRSTPFVESLSSNASFDEIKKSYLNYYLKPDQLDASIQESKELNAPLNGKTSDAFNRDHENAVRALSLITSLGNSSGRDRTRVNVQRCVEEFGRHRTDSCLPPKPASLQYLRQLEAEGSRPQLRSRSGPDTGSSEVQIAILTTKINVLADNLHKKDKHNKRNLRLLVHRRQKLLAYLKRKERGGPRWQNLVDKLGINDAMWQGEISLP